MENARLKKEVNVILEGERKLKRMVVKKLFVFFCMVLLLANLSSALNFNVRNVSDSNQSFKTKGGIFINSE